MTEKAKAQADEWRKKLRAKKRAKAMNGEQKEALQRLIDLDDAAVNRFMRNPSIRRLIGMS